jgi:hypothetical protein
MRGGQEMKKHSLVRHMRGETQLEQLEEKRDIRKKDRPTVPTDKRRVAGVRLRMAC